ncbi:MAG: TIGR00282 family metallophosphoesterase [Thermomicrobiales bacterium]
MPADEGLAFVSSASRPAPSPPGAGPAALRFLVVGDIFGEPGRRGAARFIPALREEYAIDCVIANGENAAGGRGLTEKTADELFRAGIDVLTLGNHTWSQREMLTVLKDEQVRIARPQNYPPGVPGRGFVDVEVRGAQVRVVSLMGRVFLTESLDDPFRAADDLLRATPDDAIVMVDFHAEATSEKVAMGWHLDGRVAAVFGTHTHIPTADARLLPQGTAFVTDLGMVGPQHSIIGSEVTPILHRFLTGLPVRFEVAGGPITFNAVIIEVDRRTRRGRGIWRRDMWDVDLSWAAPR